MEISTERHEMETMTANRQTRFSRNPALELFRCLLMFLIVFGHSWGQGPFSPSLREGHYVAWWEFVMIGMLIWHVDGFIAISGWFGIKFSWKKLFSLLGTIAFYTFLWDIVSYYFFNEPFSLDFLSLRSGWFGGNYLVLMMSAPLANAAIDSLARESTRGLFWSWALICIAFFFSWSPKHFFTGIHATGFGHQTYAMMLFVYLTARVARKCLKKAVPLRHLAIAVLAYFTMVIAFSMLLIWNDATDYPRVLGICEHCRVNHAPMVYLVAIVFLLVFAWHVHLPNRFGRIVLSVSPTMFGVYLFHLVILLPIEQHLANNVTWHPLMTMLASSCIAYVASIAVDMLRRVLVNMFRKQIDMRLQALDDKWARLAN